MIGRAAPAQQRMWLLAKLHPGSISYHVSSPLRLQGALDVAALRTATQRLCERHDALRTTFLEIDGDLYQRVDERPPSILEYADLSRTADAAAAAADFAETVMSRPMDLGRGPLFRISLCRLDQTTHILIMYVHHIVADAWSLGLLWEELGLLYSKEKGADITLEPAGLPFLDYAAEQWSRQQSQEAAEELRSWLHRLNGVDLDNSLRTDRPRPAVPTLRGKTLQLLIPEELVRRLRGAARALNGTPFTVLVGGFAATLAHYDRRRDVVIATQVAGRSDPRVARTAGFFVNTLPLRFDLSGDPTLSDAVQQGKDGVLAAFGTEYVTFDQLAAEFTPLGDRSMNPLAQVAFQLLNVPMPDVPFEGLTTRRWFEESTGAKFDLSVMLVPESDGGLTGRLTYATDLFEESTVTGLWTAYLTCLEALAEQPGQALWKVSLTTPEQRRAVEEWSTGPAAIPGTTRGLLETLAGHARDRAGQVAITAAQTTVTYADLWACSGGLAVTLRREGVRAGDVVVIACAARADTIRAIVGTWRAGATAMVVEAGPWPPRIGDAVRVARPTIGVCSPGAEHESYGLRWLDLRWPDLRGPDPRRPVMGAGPAGEPDPEGAAVVPEDAAYVVSTSGTTGRPRLIAARFSAFSDFIVREAARLAADQVVIQVPPLTFDPGMRDTFLALAAGVELVIPDGIDANPVDAVVDVLAEGRGDSVLAIVPGLLDGVLRKISARGLDVRLRLLRCCGDALPRSVAQRAVDVVGCAPQNDYGPSECTMVTATGDQHPAAANSAIMPIGRPVTTAEAWVLGAAGQLLPPGFTGEIHIGGPHVADGYLDDPAGTLEKFVNGECGSRRHRTGDLGYHDAAGVLHWIGRMDRQVKIRGVRVDVVEVENALLCHELVADAAVVTTGEGRDQRLIAYVVTRAPIALTEIREHLRGRLPRASIPGLIEVVATIPRTDRGKIRKDLLPPPAAGGTAPADGRRLADDLEELIAAVWCEILHVPQVASDDDFFALGGHSLTALEMAAKVSDQVGLHDPVDAFEYPTLRELADHLRPSWAEIRVESGKDHA
jgi:amino acid adenylation domain-containing protein